MSTEAEEDADLRARVGGVVGGKWRLDALLGSGGMAAVYRARGPNNQHAAVKILHPEMARKKDVRERFIREAYVANKVGHPGAVAVVEHSDSPEAYLVMELLEGEPLASRVKRQGMSEEELLGVLDQVLDVLAVAHGQGIIHRDIKPDNLFLCNDGRVEVLDFGLARMIDELPGDFKTRTGLALGTVPYMPPEQALGRRAELDGRADLFALGASAFRILSGRRVHEAPSEAELLMAMATQPVPSLASIAPQVSPYVSSIIDLSLAFSRDARYPDAKTMQGDVRAARAGQVPPFAVGQGVQTSRDAPTRVDMVAPVPSSRVAPVAGGAATDAAHGMQPSVETGPASVGRHSGAWQDAMPPNSVAGAAFDPGPETPAPASVRPGADASPPSAAPHSLQHGGVAPQTAYDSVPPASAAYPGYDTPPASLQYGAATTQPSTPPTKKRGGLLLLFLLGAVGVVGLISVGAAYAFYEYGADALEGEQLPPSAVGVSPMTTAIDPSPTGTAPTQTPSDTSKAAASSPTTAASTDTAAAGAAGSPRAAPQAASTAPQAKPQTAAAPTTPDPAPKAAPAPSPKPAATATNMVLPPAVAPPASKPEKKKEKEKKEKGKGKDKGRGKGPHK